jgi:hypothetical protein
VKSKHFFIGLAAFLILVGFALFKQYYLKKHYILLNAKTTSWVVTSKVGLELEYEFHYKGNKIVYNNPFAKFMGNKNFENKLFPVVYDPVLNTAQLLVQPENFKKFNLQFPDSLDWVLPYLR